MNKFSEVQKELQDTKQLIYFDIETSPMKFWGWGLGKQYVSHEQIYEESKVILIQWMYEGDREVSYITWDKNHDDSKMLESFSQRMKGVKVAIAQNGKQFDYKVLNWRVNVLGLTPLKNIEILDILQLSRQSFRAPSHKLDYRSKVYGCKGKIPMKLQDWIDVVQDAPGAMKKMITYGCKDVLDLRKIFWKELPYYKSMPISLAQIVHHDTKNSRDYCPKCASQRQRKYDVYPTKINNKWMMECKNCGNLWKETRERSKTEFLQE